MTRYTTVVALAEQALENSLLRHGTKVYDVAQRRFEHLLKEVAHNDFRASTNRPSYRDELPSR